VKAYVRTSPNWPQLERENRKQEQKILPTEQELKAGAEDLITEGIDSPFLGGSFVNIEILY
jgi:hypothetical protein